MATMFRHGLLSHNPLLVHEGAEFPLAGGGCRRSSVPTSHTDRRGARTQIAQFGARSLSSEHLVEVPAGALAVLAPRHWITASEAQLAEGNEYVLSDDQIGPVRIEVQVTEQVLLES